MSNLVSFARDELTRAGFFDQDADYGGLLGHAVMKMMEVFSEEEHSGASAALAVSLFEKLARFQPLTPLTGDADEWNEVGVQNGRPLFQNRRCGSVFKEGDEAYDIDGRVFREPSGACFTNKDSRAPVTFPYTPTTEYVDVTGDGRG
jgi:hypothetical protein